MFLYGLGGFIGGMILGAVLNGVLLKDVPKEEWRKNRDLKMKYGGLNWLIALAGMVAGLFLSRLN
ncbi:MAG TPA: hypothetical protein VGF14_00965 [Alphaproteobacteria bacterium]